MPKDRISDAIITEIECILFPNLPTVYVVEESIPESGITVHNSDFWGRLTSIQYANFVGILIPLPGGNTFTKPRVDF